LGDKWTEVFECYDIEVKNNSKGRYAQIVETNQGVMQLRPMSESQGRLKSEYDFKERMYEAGFEDTDRLIHNRDGELSAPDRYGNMYVLRRYFTGREINVTNMSELDMAVENLARLHMAGRSVWQELCEANAVLPTVRTNYDLERRNRELKRTRAYISKLVNKSGFEEVYLGVYDRFYTQAEHAADEEKALKDRCGEKLKFHFGYCHGDYNNHNILVTGKGRKPATVGFDRFYVGNQLSDLYYFARKAVEKNAYNFEVLRRIIDTYGRYIELDSADLEYIYILFSYPEKFYKLSNRYMNASKVRISPVMSDKLGQIINSELKKFKILAKYREIFLHI
jgi:spore coat protein I